MEDIVYPAYLSQVQNPGIEAGSTEHTYEENKQKGKISYYSPLKGTLSRG